MKGHKKQDKMNIETLTIKHSRDKRIFSLQNQGVKVSILAIYF